MPSTTPPLMGGPVAEVNSEDPVPSERQDLIAGTDPNGAYSHPSIPCFLGSSAEFSNILSVPGETRLAYLDSVGFAERSSRQKPNVQFRGILEKYAAVTRRIQNGMAALDLVTGHAQAQRGDARCLPLAASSIDGILFSPPYSFAVDYVENDAPHLRLMGANLDELRERMVGLRGRSLREKFDAYIKDMQQVLTECVRVLRPGRCCAIVIGTNRNQLGKVFDQDPAEVEGLDLQMIRLAEAVGLNFVRRFERRIVGLANTMRDEDILLLRKECSRSS